MTSYVENESNVNFPFDIKELADQVILTVLESEKCPFKTQVNLLLTDNAGIRTFNAQFRQMDKETDVLSFPNINYEQPSDFSQIEGDEADYFDPESGELILGDIIISVDRIKSQALEYGHSERREFAFLVAHSMFHLCGYDHMTLSDAVQMENKQEVILENLGITREDI
ncbi:MAG TPA: rRNA maturation RNase YbeY [Lachnospiraceae bacterium]|nr:rRNA maturation RNase YbeY [Lachnospiraceae bacterium]